MAQKFVLTAQLQLQAPKNIRRVVDDINKQLRGVKVDIDVKGAAKAQKDVKAAADATKQLGKESEKASGGIRKMDLALGKALKQVFRYDIARGVLNLFRRTLEDNVKAAIDFEREMIKVAQVTQRSMASLRDLQNEISRLSVSLGVSSASLVKTSRVLAQTGLSAKDVKVALESLAKTTLAPTFEDIADTTETAIAAMRQFKLEASDLERVLGQINAVAGKFAVEAGDIGVAIRRAGGAFKSAGGELTELIALFTSVRATTRETAETIATGFRTIFTRMQRPETIEFLRQFGIELQDIEGKFVGPYEAVNRLNAALKNLDPRDVRYSQIVEQLGGFRQVSKVIPLIQQFSTAQAALNVAQKESGGLSRDALTAQASLAVQIQKLTEDVKELFREIVSSKAFQVLAGGALKLANALVKIGDALAPVLPMLATLGAVKIAQFGFGRIFGGGGGAVGKQFGGRVNRFSSGGLVPGKGNGDTVPAMLESGEFVVRKKAVNSIGAGNLAGMNRYAKGGITKMSSGFGRGNILRTGLNPSKDAGEFTQGEHAFTDAGAGGEKEDSIVAKIMPRQLNIETLLKRKGILKPSADKNRKGKYDVAHGWKGKLISYTGSGGNPAAQGNMFEQLLVESGYLKQGKGFGGKAPLDGTVKGILAEVKRSEVSDNKILDKRLRHEFATNKLSSQKLSGGADKIGLSPVKQVIDSLGKDSKRLSSFRGKLFASGGAVGTDTVPSLLTPGEFVVNKKSAQSIGYGNLHSMNKMAEGGVVGGGGFMEEGGGGGGLDLTSIMMQFAMLQGVMGGFGTKAGDAADGLDKTARAAGGMKAAMGEMMPVLGNIAQTGMMVYTKWAVLGGIATQVGDSMFGASEAMHNFIFTVQMAGVALEMFSIMRGMDLSGLMSGLSMLGDKITQIAASSFGMGKALLMGSGAAGAAKFTQKASGALKSAGQRVGGYAQGTRASFRTGYMGANDIGMGIGDSPGKIIRRGASRAQYGRYGANLSSQAGQAGFRATQTGRLGGTSLKGLSTTQKSLAMMNRAMQTSTKTFGSMTKMAAGAGKGMNVLAAGALVADLALANWAGNLATESRAEGRAALQAGRELTDEEKGKARKAEVVGAASTGATVGAVVGTAAGILAAVLSGGALLPIVAVFSTAGTAIGAAVGAWITSINGASAAAEAASKIEFAAAVGQWEKAVTQHGKGLRTTQSTLREYGEANKAAGKRAGELVQRGWFWDVEASDESVQALEEFNQALKDAIPEILGMAQAAAFEKTNADTQRSETGSVSRTTVTAAGRVQTKQVEGEEAAATRFAEENFVNFEKELAYTGKSLNEYAVLQGKTVEKLKADIMAEAEAHYKVTQAMKEFDEAMKKSTENLMKSIEVSDAVRSMGASISAVDNQMANLSSGMDGAVSTGKMGDRFSSAEVASISTGSEIEAFEDRVNNLAGEMGSGGQALAKDMLGAQKLMSNVTGALAAEKDVGKVEGQSMGKRVMDRLESDIDSQFGAGTFSGLPDHLKKKVKARLDAATAETEGGKGFDEAFEEAGAAIESDLSGAFEPMRQSFEAMGKLMDTFNNQLANAYAERRKVEMEIIQAQKGVVDMAYQNAERLAKMEGRDMSQGDFRASEIKKQQIQLGGTDIAAASGGTDLVGAGDLGAELMNLRGKIQASNDKLANFGSGVGSTGDDTKKLGDKFAEAQKENDNLKKQYKQVEGALKSYTNIQERLSVVTQELTRLQEIRAAKEKTMEDLAFGTDEDREKFADSVGSLQQALAGGLESIGGDERQNVKALLDSMADGQVFAGTGQTKEEMMDQLKTGRGSMIQRLGGAAWQTDEAKGRMGLAATQEEKDKIDEAKGIMQEGETAAEALIEPMKAQAQELNDILATIHENFLTKFQQILEEKFQTREEKEKAAQEAKMGSAEDKRGAMEDALKKMIGEEKFATLSDEEKDTRISALKGQEENLDTMLAAPEKAMMAEKAAELTAGGKDFFDKSAGGNAFGDGYIDDENIDTQAEASRFLGAMETELEKKARAKMTDAGITGEDQQKGVDEVMRGFEEWKQAIGGKSGLAAMGDEMDEIFTDFDTHMASRAETIRDKSDTAKDDFTSDMGAAGFTGEEMGKLQDQGFADSVLSDLEKFAADDTFTKLGDSINKATDRINEATNNIVDSQAESAAVENRGDAYRAKGGMIYASGGAFVPRGTDTIPAMLTPGEFVVRRQAVQSLGVPFLKALNSQGAKGIAKGFSKGGAAYLAEGGMGVSLDSSAFDASVNRFSGQIDKLGEVLGRGFNVQVAGKVDVVVHLNGGEILAGAKESLGAMAEQKITKGINDMLATHFPQIGRQSSLLKKPSLGDSLGFTD